MVEERGPTNRLVTPLLTDLYQLSMAYGYWHCGRQDEPACFELFFRRNPFGGEFTVLAGVEELLRLVATFRFSPSELDFLSKSPVFAALPAENAKRFFEWLSTVDCSKVIVRAIPEGTLVFPRVPLVRIEGPLAVCQLLETPALNLIGFASLVCTNAARMRRAAGEGKLMLEMGLRRAQGPDGGISASRYAVQGLFDGSSNVQAGRLFGVPISGTMAHSYVTSFQGWGEVSQLTVQGADGAPFDLVAAVHEIAKTEVVAADGVAANESELAAFTAYAVAFPHNVIALVDTYDTLASGVVNFLVVALALHRAGLRAVGIRLDSGDLAFLSREARRMFRAWGARYAAEGFDAACDDFKIAASNDLNEETILSSMLRGTRLTSSASARTSRRARPSRRSVASTSSSR